MKAESLADLVTKARDSGPEGRDQILTIERESQP